MRKAFYEQILVGMAILLAGCGGGGGDSSTTGPDTGTSECSRSFGTLSYAVSTPLVDNSAESAYKILLMGNSHSAALAPVLEQLLRLAHPEKSVDVANAGNPGFLSDRVNDGVSEQALECEPWTHVILQGQKYSTSGGTTYPTDAAEYWIRGSKELGATAILFPEHPRMDNNWEGQALWDLHTGIATRENACVAPVGPVWDEVVFRDPSLVLHQADGNHASDTGVLLSALVFYPIISGQPVESLPSLSGFGIDAETEQLFKESVSSLLFAYTACNYGT
jgi:hypothetical protein